jgi:hypothetical protein
MPMQQLHYLFRHGYVAIASSGTSVAPSLPPPTPVARTGTHDDLFEIAYKLILKFRDWGKRVCCALSSKDAIS